jgi:pentatricopeptide repeat protein
LKAYQLFQEMEQPPDPVSYNITLNALAQEGKYEHAQELFFQLLESLDNKETMVDPIPLRTALKASAQANTRKAAIHAENLVKTLQSLPCVDARAYCTVIAMWCKLQQPERAKLLLAELTSLYLDSPPSSKNHPRWQPDPISFRMVIGSFSQKIESIMESPTNNNNSHGKKNWEEARILATAAQEVFMDMYTIMKYDPNLITCNAILKCWCQARQPEAAEDFLQQMLHWDMAPDIVSYNTVIACYGKLGNVPACTAWLSKMAQPESPFPTPNTRTVTAVITALSKRGTEEAAEEAEAWFMHMQEWHSEWGWDCSPNQVTLNALLGCWARIGNGPRAEYILRQFQSYHCNCNIHDHSQASPDIVSYNTVIHAYGKDMTKIQCLLEELIAVGLQPNKRTVGLVQNALEQDPSIQDKVHKWNELKQRFFYFINTTTSSATTKKSRDN